MAKKKKPSDEGQENTDNANDADNFGLPEIDYKPLDAAQENPAGNISESIEPTQVVQSTSYTRQENPAGRESENRSIYSYNMEEDNKSNAPMVIGVVIVLVLVVGGFLIYQYAWKPQKEKERRELLAREAANKKQQESARLAQLQKEEEERQRLADLAAANVQPTEGTIETLSDRTMRYYVVITSAIDDDLVMDYAKKLSAKGVSTKIIPPFGRYKFSRLAISDYDTFAGAQSNADAAKTEYGSAVWVLKF